MAHGVSVMRHGLPYESIDTLFKATSKVETTEELWMPLVGLLTGARLAELVYVQSSDIQRQNGTWIIDLTTQISAPGRTTRRALKTANARRFIVLHEFLETCGFIEWARRQKDWVFEGLHDAKSPANAASKRFQRKFREWGMAGDRVEVFHALRHTYKDWARAQKIEERTIALQTGHSLQGVALQYGTKALRPDEMRLLAQMPIPSEWPMHYYEGLEPRLQRFADERRFEKHYKRQAQLNVAKNFIKAEE
jgi:integrase